MSDDSRMVVLTGILVGTVYRKTSQSGNTYRSFDIVQDKGTKREQTVHVTVFGDERYKNWLDNVRPGTSLFVHGELRSEAKNVNGRTFFNVSVIGKNVSETQLYASRGFAGKPQEKQQGNYNSDEDVVKLAEELGLRKRGNGGAEKEPPLSF